MRFFRLIHAWFTSTPPASKEKEPFLKSKTELELQELNLRVQELEYKIKEMARPQHFRLSFWTAVVGIPTAILGFIIQHEFYKYDLMLTNKEIFLTTDSLETLRDSLKRVKTGLDSSLALWSRVNSSRAFDSTAAADTTPVAKAVAKEYSNIKKLIDRNNATGVLLQNAVVRVLYDPVGRPNSRLKAWDIYNLLNKKKVQVTFRAPIPRNQLKDIQNNEIVYFNNAQRIYCEAVQQLLTTEGYRDFKLKLSTVPSDRVYYFKLYVVE